MGQSYSGRARPQSAAAPSSPRIRELEETNDTLRRNYRLAQVEQENDALRRQLDQLKVAREYDPSNPMVKYSPRRAHRRANLPITGAMGHDQMVREAKLRAQHNKQRAQLKGYIRGAAAGGDYVHHGDLALAAQLAKMAVPASLYSPRKGDPWRKGHMAGHHVPWRDVIGSISYPEVGTEAVKNEAQRIAKTKADRLAAEAMKGQVHREAVVAQSQDEGISEKDLRYYHAMIRDHFATRFTQVRKAFRTLDEDASGKLSHDEMKQVLMMFNLSIPAKIINKIIQLADVDGDGEIDYAEFARVMTADDIISAYGVTGLGQAAPRRVGPATLRPGVTETDIRHAQKTLRAEFEEKYSKLTDAFKFIDTDRTGQLERSEIKGLMLQFNIHDVSDAAMDNLIDFADFDGDGQINYAEFCRCLTADDILSMKQTLSAIDPSTAVKVPIYAS